MSKEQPPINQPANKQSIGSPASPAEQRRQATKVATPIMQPPPGSNQAPLSIPDVDEIERQLEGTKMAVPKPETPPIPPAQSTAAAIGDPSKRQPGAKVYDANDVLQRRRRILQNLGISDLVLPPITKQTSATYRMISNNKINPATGKPNDPGFTSIPGTYLFYDPGEADPSRRSIIMRNLTGRPGLELNPNTGKEETVPNASGWIEFFNGLVQVDTVKQFIKYVFLELHPLNASNRFRDRSVPAVFERVDIKSQKTYMFDAAELDMARDAEDTVLKMSRETVLAFAGAANIPTMDNGLPRRADEMKHDLRVFARNNPKGFFSLAGNTKAAIRTNVIDLKHLGLIEFDAEKHRWFDFNSEQTIHVVPRGEDPTISLVEFLDEPENEEIYQALLKLLNYWQREDLQLVEFDAA